MVPRSANDCEKNTSFPSEYLTPVKKSGMREMKSDSLLSTSPTQPANNKPYLVREDNHSCRFKINSSSTAQIRIARICCFDTGFGLCSLRQVRHCGRNIPKELAKETSSRITMINDGHSEMTSFWPGNSHLQPEY